MTVMKSWMEIYFLSWQISIKLRRCSWRRWWLHQNIRQLHACMHSHHLQQPLQDQGNHFQSTGCFSKNGTPGLQIIIKLPRGPGVTSLSIRSLQGALGGPECYFQDVPIASWRLKTQQDGSVKVGELMGGWRLVGRFLI